MAKIIVLVLTIVVFVIEHWQAKTPEQEAWKDVGNFDTALAARDTAAVAVYLRDLDRL